jgi:hypothetical protein
MNNSCICLLYAALLTLQPAWGQPDPSTGAATGTESPRAEDGKASNAAVEHPQIGPSEFDLQMDDAVKLRVEPVQVSNLVDRLLEPSTITVKCREALSVQIFVMPVDAPYGGVPLGRPKLVASDNHPGSAYAFRWDSKEPNPYIKIFAVVRRQRDPYAFVRSRALDFAVGGMRYAPSRPVGGS